MTACVEVGVLEESLAGTFSKRISLLLERRKTTGYKVSLSTGIPHQAFYRYCSGEALPNAESLCALADFFGVSTDYLLGRS